MQERVDELDQVRKKRRVEKIMEEKRRLEKIRRDNRPLSSRNRISAANIEKFIELLSTEVDVKSLLAEKPLNFRKIVVRIVMSMEGEIGNTLRQLWVDIYVGDGRNGVMSAREEAKEENWPKNKRQPSVQDRNYWNVYFLKKICTLTLDKSELAAAAL